MFGALFMERITDMSYNFEKVNKKEEGTNYVANKRRSNGVDS